MTSIRISFAVSTLKSKVDESRRVLRGVGKTAKDGVRLREGAIINKTRSQSA